MNASFYKSHLGHSVSSHVIERWLGQTQTQNTHVHAPNTIFIQSVTFNKPCFDFLVLYSSLHLQFHIFHFKLSRSTLICLSASVSTYFSPHSAATLVFADLKILSDNFIFERTMWKCFCRRKGLCLTCHLNLLHR